MSSKWKRIVAFVLVAVMVFSLMPSGSFRAIAADGDLYGYTYTNGSNNSPYYIMVYEDGAWTSKYNDIHYLAESRDADTKYWAYCLESNYKSPGNLVYHDAGSSALTSAYSTAALNGIKTIFRLGYPNSNTFNGVTLTDVQARAATQTAIRFFLSYRQTVDTGYNYHVIANLNPERSSNPPRAAQNRGLRRNNKPLDIVHLYYSTSPVNNKLVLLRNKQLPRTIA